MIAGAIVALVALALLREAIAVVIFWVTFAIVGGVTQEPGIGVLAALVTTIIWEIIAIVWIIGDVAHLITLLQGAS